MIIYTTSAGTVAVCNKVSSVPEGVTYHEVASVPDRAYREAWVINNGVIEIDPTKQAKVDTRLQREVETTQNKGDVAIKQIINASPQQIESYINTNVTNLAQARSFLIKLTKAVSAIGRESFT